MRAVLTDIEGTTTAVSFVTETLFPYARARIPAWVRARWEDPSLVEIFAALQHEAGVQGADESVAALLRWMDEDRKIGPLKTIQGLIWEGGYRDGTLRSHLYPDVAPALRRWRASGLTLAVYSSGSVAAQRLLFGHTPEGDLCPLFSAFFDTATGPKRAAESYRRVAAALALPAPEILFLSDVPEELDAAREAGMLTAWLVREGPPPEAPRHPVYPDFTGLPVEVAAEVEAPPAG